MTSRCSPKELAAEPARRYERSPAYADSGDSDHTRCLEVLDSEPSRRITTALVVAEIGWLIDRQLGPAAEATLYESIGNVRRRWSPSASGLAARRRADRDYADNCLGGVDSSIVAVAERLRITTIATLDERHFRVARPAHVDAFRLVP